jgi:N,N'-diacetyllegionaminate synthase
MSNKTVIIAEAGVNHNGDLDQAKKLIEAAASSGADYIKFQTFTAEQLVTPEAHKAEYQKNASDDKETQYELLNKLELSEEDHFELLNYANTLGIKFLSTGFDINSVKFLMQLGQKIIKIPSGEITNRPYLQYVGSLRKEVILSTGMSTLLEVENAIEIITNFGTPRELLTVLHCTSEYPTPMSDVNLLAMVNMREKLKINVGYSDHTLGIVVSIAAVALGAKVIEKHITLDKNLPGPDHQASILPTELREMVSAIRSIEIALGRPNKMPTEFEMLNRTATRKSIIAKRNIMKGEILTEENITVKRPGNGLSPMLWPNIIGTNAVRNFIKNELIEIL